MFCLIQNSIISNHLDSLGCKLALKFFTVEHFPHSLAHYYIVSVKVVFRDSAVTLGC